MTDDVPENGFRAGAVLLAYRCVAEIVRVVAFAGTPFWPARWRVKERLHPPPSPFPKGGNEEVIWMHAASLGECKGLWALARALRTPGVRFVLTANTDAGLAFLREAVARDPEAHRLYAAPAPLDHPRIARRFLEAFRVRALVTFEVELWPHRFLAAQRAGVQVLWVSARWNARARRRYGIASAAARRVLREIAWTQAQSPEDADALRRAGCPRVETGADLRGLQYLDLRPADAAPGSSGRRGVAFVSFHARELPTLVAMMREAPEDGPVFVFPRKLREIAAFRDALASLGFALHSENPSAARRIVDRFGLVGIALREARFAVVGGSFAEGIGGHNLWEPWLAGCRVAIGPRHENQAWLAQRLRAAGILRVIDAPGAWRSFLAEPDAAEEGNASARLEGQVRSELSNAVASVRERLVEALSTRRAGI